MHFPMPDDDRPDATEAAGSHQEPLRERLAEAAVEAEFRTGVREATVAQAKSAILVRLARMTLGFLVVLAGIVMLPLPGPAGS